jgi:hypothetical protein
MLLRGYFLYRLEGKRVRLFRVSLYMFEAFLPAFREFINEFFEFFTIFMK